MSIEPAKRYKSLRRYNNSQRIYSYMYRVREKFSHLLVLRTSTIIIKFGCPKSKSSCPKSLARNSKLKNNQVFHVSNHIITLINCF